MRPILIALLLMIGVTAVASAQNDPYRFRLLDYHTMTDWIPETPGVTSGAPGGFINPATWSTLQEGRPEFAFWWDDRSVRSGKLDNWGFSTSGWLGFGANSRIHTSKILRLSKDLPVVIEIVDDREKLEDFLAAADAAIHGGLATLEKASVHFYRSRDR